MGEITTQSEHIHPDLWKITALKLIMHCLVSNQDRLGVCRLGKSVFRRTMLGKKALSGERFVTHFTFVWQDTGVRHTNVYLQI